MNNLSERAETSGLSAGKSPRQWYCLPVGEGVLLAMEGFGAVLLGAAVWASAGPEFPQRRARRARPLPIRTISFCKSWSKVMDDLGCRATYYPPDGRKRAWDRPAVILAKLPRCRFRIFSGSTARKAV